MFRIVPLVILACWLVGPAAAQTVLHVDADRPDGGDGLAWDTAFGDLQDALAAARELAAPVDLWIAEGTYRADRLEGSPFRSFEVAGDMRLLGGFAGHENDAAERDWSAHPVILDGDLWGDDYPDFGGYTNNTRHLVQAIDLSGPVTLDGLTLRGGFAYNAPDLLLGGGGIYALRSDVSVANCRFEANWAGYNQPSVGNFGAAIYLKGSGLLEVRDSVFTGNRGGAAGGAVMGLGRDGGRVDIHLYDCEFLANAARQDGASGVGGAVAHSLGGELVIERCDFEGNDADYAGALKTTLVEKVVIRDTRFHANTGDGRAAVHLERSDGDDTTPAVLERCSFTENRILFGELHGSALYLEETIGHVTSCEFLDNENMYVNEHGVLTGGVTVYVGFEEGHRFVNCLLARNRSSLAAGLLFREATATLANSTLVANRAANGAAGVGLYIQDSALTIANTLIWGNRAGTGLDWDQPGSGEEHFQIAWYNVAPVVSHSIVENWTGDLGGVQNSGLDPNFVAFAAGDYRLEWPSPAIDTGDDGAVPAGVLADLDGEARIQDGDGDGTATVDRGAYEAAADLSGVDDPVVAGFDGGLRLRCAPGVGGATISFAIPRAGSVRLSVHDLRGRRVAVLVDGWREAGAGEVVWNGRGRGGERVASGTYLLELKTGRRRATGRVVLVR